MRRKTNEKKEKTRNEKRVQQNENVSVKSVVRNYKDTLFRMIFRDKKELLTLYNAVNGTHYDNSEDLEITTLENAIYMNMKNDVSCILDMRMNLYEHQSSVNPNIPLRDLFYVARLYEKFTAGKDLYSSKRIMIPTPKFIVFYNGVTPQPERVVMRLSDSFQQKENVNLELVVTQLNINPGCNEELMKNCPTLYQYMCYVEKVRTYNKTMAIADAVAVAVDECIKEEILADFLRRNKAEAIQMSIFEYDQELHDKTLLEEGYEVGVAEGITRGRTEGRTEFILILLKKLGDVPDEVTQKIMSIKDEQLLEQLFELATEVKSIEEYQEQMIKFIK